MYSQFFSSVYFPFVIAPCTQFMFLAESDTSGQLCAFPSTRPQGSAALPSWGSSTAQAIAQSQRASRTQSQNMRETLLFSRCTYKSWLLKILLLLAHQTASLLSAQANELHGPAPRACGWEPVANMERSRTAPFCSSTLLGELKQSHKFTLRLQEEPMQLSSRAWIGNSLQPSKFLTAFLLQRWLPFHSGGDPPLQVLGPLWSSSAYYCVSANRICKDEADARITMDVSSPPHRPGESTVFGGTRRCEMP